MAAGEAGTGRNKDAAEGSCRWRRSLQLQRTSIPPDRPPASRPHPAPPPPHTPLPLQGRYLNTPELVPFRLTRDVVDGMGVAGVEGVMRRCCEETLRVRGRRRDGVDGSG